MLEKQKAEGNRPEVRMLHEKIYMQKKINPLNRLHQEIGSYVQVNDYFVMNV
jgi:hypothetical protein